MSLRDDAQQIFSDAISACMPDEAVKRALNTAKPSGRVTVIAAGKAAWRMARAAIDALGNQVVAGAVVTKYGHSLGELPPLKVFEAGHPVVDKNGVKAAEYALSLVRGLCSDDEVLFLVSGGASALFELPLVPLSELSDINRQLLACGADIGEMNAVRKRLSAVKGGRFALACAPAKVLTVALSDVIGDRLDIIGSGPTAPDLTTCAQALEVVEKYGLKLSDDALAMLKKETPSELTNANALVTGSVRELQAAAAKTAEKLGYKTFIIENPLTCLAHEAAEDFAKLARENIGAEHPMAFIAGGETVVQLCENPGKGGRNQELALAAAGKISGLEGCAVFSVGSDGTDGPTDAAGGYCDGHTLAALKDAGVDYAHALATNSSYDALNAVGGLIFTGATGTNVNDLYVLLIKN